MNQKQKVLKLTKTKVAGALAASVLALGITLVPRNANTYSHGTMEDPSIHPLLVDELMDFYSNPKINSELNQIKQGSIDEDSPPYYIRSFNHFMDFETGEGIFGFASANEWATSSELQGGDVLLDKLPSVLQKYYKKLGLEVKYPFGDNSWDRVVENYQSSGEIGVEFGHIFHLISDMTVPAHVRNDPHWGEVPFLESLTSGSYFQVSLWPTDAYEVWTDDHRNEIMSQLNPENVPKFDSLDELMQDLAHFTSSNFYSDGETIDVMGILASTNYSPVKDMYKLKEGKKVYYAKVIEGKEVHLLRKGILSSWTDNTCLADYWSVLGTKAVEYGAAALEILVEEEVSTCTDKCDSGETKCYSDGFKVCDDYNGDGCVEWGDVNYCDSDEYCDNGECVPEGTPCTDNCNYIGEKICADFNVNVVDECEDLNEDGCLEWIAYNCQSGYICADGECVPEGTPCTDECSNIGENSCIGNSVRGCAYNNTDDCLDWVFVKSCGSEYTCENGECIGGSGSGQLCDTCNSYEDCQEGMYCGSFADGMNLCAPNINCSSSADCPENFLCSGYTQVCAITAGWSCKSSTEVGLLNSCGKWEEGYTVSCTSCNNSWCPSPVLEKLCEDPEDICKG